MFAREDRGVWGVGLAKSVWVEFATRLDVTVGKPVPQKNATNASLKSVEEAVGYVPSGTFFSTALDKLKEGDGIVKNVTTMTVLELGMVAVASLFGLLIVIGVGLRCKYTYCSADDDAESTQGAASNSIICLRPRDCWLWCRIRRRRCSLHGMC